MGSHYSLKCLATGAEFDDSQLLLANPTLESPAFLRTIYSNKSFAPTSSDRSIYRFADWLPVRRTLEGSSAPVTYRSTGLAEALGLENLYVTFSGYWPERGVKMLTGTFKECEAYSVCGRMDDSFGSTLVVASAGNTARAFSRVCSDNKIPLVVVIPEANLKALWSIGPLDTCVRVVAAGGDSDYSDAIALSGIITSLPGFEPEGGAKNVARRDGMGTTVLSAVDVIGSIPDHYFQAVGSGTGAIAAWEANLRLIESGAYGNTKMKLHVSQNAPFQLIHDSWTAKSRSLVDISEDQARAQVATIQAKVLANRKPPYGLVGGLFDALTDTNGTTAALSNEEAQAAATLFLETEGIDIAPAASVAVADLVQSVKQSSVGAADTVMLNITGGGFLGINDSQDVRPIPATRVIGRGNFNAEYVASVLAEIF